MVMHGRHAASHPRALRVPQLVLSGVPPVSSMSQRASDSTDTAPLWSNEDQRACSTPGADGDVDDWTASPTATAACFCCTVVVVMGFFMLGMMKNGMGGVLLLLSVLPGMAILFFAYWWQQYHTVKFPMVAWTYFGGIVGALPVAVVEWIIMASVFVPVGHTDVPADTHPLATRLVVAFFMAFIVASLVEECFKFFIVYTAVHFTRVRMAYGVVVLGLAGALGFATLENAAYVLGASTAASPEEGFKIAVFRAILAVPLHAATGAMIGVAVARRLHGEELPAWKILAIPFLIHGLYDFLLMSAAIPKSMAWEGIALLGACGLVIVGCVVASAQVSRLLDAAQGSEWQRVSMRVGGKGYDTCV